ncbi:hypothetical protein C2G38_2150948 [Gigaspora rosea]|uniref:Uncharacterized protein n=1 Tax=Gigaspora rosea TaxID=44941 RepID=A0A397TRY1_9GLOM|nr:hypothetical protein C2G38_2150948 [Gigaspora rosea]
MSKHSKEDSKDEALQQLYQLRPDLNDQSVWFFSTLKKSAEGRILYEKTEKHAYLYDTITQKRFSSFSAWIKALSSQHFFKGKKSALATIFLKPNCNEINIGQIIKGKNYSPYFKNIQIGTLLSIKDTLTTMIYDDVKLTGINLTEGEGFLCLAFFETNLKKELYIKKTIHGCREPIKCTVFVNSLEVNVLKERFEQATYLRGDHLYSNFIGPENNHEIIANLENKGLDNEAYRRIDYTLLVLNGKICANCKTLHNTLYQIENRYKNGIQSVKTTHASRKLLTEIVQKARKKELVESLRDGLKLKFEAKEEQVSEPLTGWQNKVVNRMVASMEANNVWGYARLGFFLHDSFKIQKGLLGVNVTINMLDTLTLIMKMPNLKHSVNNVSMIFKPQVIILA